jgi:hypothetical protein
MDDIPEQREERRKNPAQAAAYIAGETGGLIGFLIIKKSCLAMRGKSDKSNAFPLTGARLAHRNWA